MNEVMTNKEALTVLCEVLTMLDSVEVRGRQNCRNVAAASINIERVCAFLSRPDGVPQVVTAEEKVESPIEAIEKAE